MSIGKEMEKYFTEKSMQDKFFAKREIFLWGAIDETLSEDIVKKILYLDCDSSDPIKLYINSPGGVISSGLAIYDAMQSCKSKVATVCTGQAASMAAVLLCAGEKKMREAWQHARIMIHQPLVSGQMIGPASDIKIQADEMLRLRKELNAILAQHSGKPVERVEEDTDRDYYMSAQQAKEYGLIDGISK